MWERPTVLEIGNAMGFGVRDPRGRMIGLVEAPLYGREPDRPDALAIRSGRLVHRHFIVPLSLIADVDGDEGVIDLLVSRSDLQRFL
jgi:hypothetical protein